MAGTSTKKLFSAEIKMLKESGLDLPRHVFEAHGLEDVPAPESKGVTNAQLLSAILELQIIMRQNKSAPAPALVEPPK